VAVAGSWQLAAGSAGSQGPGALATTTTSLYQQPGGALSLLRFVVLLGAPALLLPKFQHGFLFSATCDRGL
jgi:hypothetical protein